jgi:O-antigen ligase
MKGLLKTAEKCLFYSIIFSIPLNLGKHFVVESSYVYSKLVDYVIPALYLQDLLIFALILLSFPRLVKALTVCLKNWEFRLILIFLAAVLVSVLGAVRPIPSWESFARLVVYSFFGLYVYSQVSLYKTLPTLLRIFALQLFLLSVLGFLQWSGNSSVFNDYLMFGEQPYNASTPQIVRVSFGGIARVPPYGLFRHPNTFAAYLVFCMLFILGVQPRKKINYLPVALGAVCLLLTFSRVGVVSLVLGLAMLRIPRSKAPYFFTAVVLSGFLANILLILSASTDASIFRRKNLLIVGLGLLGRFPLQGVGLNNFVYYVDLASVDLNFPKFTQPIHNSYLLIAVESGIVAITSFLSFLYLLFKKTLRFLKDINSGPYPRLLLALSLSLIFSAFFDHFTITSHQVNLLVWLTLGMTLQYNLK